MNNAARENSLTRRAWLVVGSVRNWNVAFGSGNIWGLRSGRLLEVLWDVLREGDLLLFYAHKPVGGVVGLGTVKTKFMQDSKPLWPDEVRASKVLYPLRFEFDVEFCLPPQRWAEGKAGSVELKNFVRAGFQPLKSRTAHHIVEQLAPLEAGRFWVSGEETAFVPAAVTSSDATVTSGHEEAKRLLVEIGRIQKFLAEPEFPIDAGRLDVVWRRVEKSVPTYVFEVQVGGDIYHAIAKLKQAFDVWNSHIFLVSEPEQKGKLDQLLSGTFHEIRGRLRFIPIQTLRELYERKSSYKKLEEELGIL
jgi:EVE domain